MSIRVFTGPGPINEGFVRTREGGSSPSFRKIVRRLVDLSAVAPGTAINIGAADVAIYSDFPVDIRVGDSAQPMSNVSQVRLVGWVDKIQVRKTWASAHGRLVIYAAIPYLGVGFDREDPRRLTRHILNPALPVVWGAGNLQVTGATIAMPWPVLGIPTECHYLFSIQAWRSAGTIEYVEYIESETGTNQVPMMHTEKTVTDRLVLRDPEGIRLCSAGSLVFTGSAEGAATNLYLYYEVAMI